MSINPVNSAPPLISEKLIQLKPASTWRSLYSLIQAIRGLWNTYFRSNIAVSIDRDVNVKIYELRDFNLRNSINTIAQKKFQTGAVIKSYGEALEKQKTILKFHPDFAFFFQPKSKEDVENKLEEILFDCSNDQLIAIPLVLKGVCGSVDHIVTVVVDCANKKVEYYDSKGLSILDQKNRALASAPTVTLFECIENITKKVSKNWDMSPSEVGIIENIKIHQKDHHNCGIYVANYLERRCDRETAQDIHKNPLSFQDANDTFRSKMITLIMDKTAPEKAPQNHADFTDDVDF